MNTVHPGSTNDHHLDPERSLALRRAAKASFIGNFIEWFDYASYTYLASVIGIVFFPGGDKSARLLEAYAVFAMSFILRPIGAIVWGAWGDRWGRRWALSWSILIMSGSTFLIGLLPPHSAIGILGAIGLLLLRMIQGFSASGEYAGAGTFLAEYSPPSQRGIYTSLVPASTACGLLAGSLTATGMFSMLSDSAVNTWGWRIPFLLSGPLGLIGRYIRVHLEDSPAYQEMRAEMPQEQKSAGWSEPLRLLFRDHRHQKIVSIIFVAHLCSSRAWVLPGHGELRHLGDTCVLHRLNLPHGSHVRLLRAPPYADLRLHCLYCGEYSTVRRHDQGYYAHGGHPVPDRFRYRLDGQ